MMTKEATRTWLEQERSRLGRELGKLATELLGNYGEVTYPTDEGEIRELKVQIDEPKEIKINLTFWPTKTKFDSIFVTSVSSGDPESKTCLIINRMTGGITNHYAGREATIPELTQHLNLLQRAKDILQSQNTPDPTTIY